MAVPLLSCEYELQATTKKQNIKYKHQNDGFNRDTREE